MFYKIYRLFANKYSLTFLAFLVWMIFFDNTNLREQARLSSQLKELKREKEFYLEGIESSRKAAEELSSDSRQLEKFAREKYLMKKENEDIYIIVEEKKDEK
jgi:cell division protein FtsB